VTGFRQKAHLDTYSGGTVRDSHPILLFSIPGHTPDLPHIGLSICQKHYNTAPNQNQVEAAGKEIAVDRSVTDQLQSEVCLLASEAASP